MTMGDRVALMKGGVLQQVGEPQYLYDNPDNIFVAGFIGSPPMNMALGRLSADAGGLSLQMGQATLPLHESQAATRPKLVSYVGREVAVGVRSEDMEDARLVRGAGNEPRLRATVSNVEALGSTIMVHFGVEAAKVETEDIKELEKDAHAAEAVVRADGVPFVASFAPRSRVRVGDTVEVVVDTERMHFFDPSTGVAIRD
jgi:multiple sugar transport system ATP-binding protein